MRNLAEAHTTSHRRRRRSRKHRSAQQQAGWIAFVRGGRFGAFIFAGMLVAAVGYVALALHFVQGVGASYGPLTIGMSEAEVAANLGAPHFNRDIISENRDENRPRYMVGGSIYRIHHDMDGRLVEGTCTDVDPQQSTCAPVLSVRIGSTEGDVLRALGPADTVKLEGRGTLRRLAYRGLGFEFSVLRGEVVAISHIAPGGLAAQARAAIWQALP